MAWYLTLDVDSPSASWRMRYAVRDWLYGVRVFSDVL
jgi:hypothetical protein